MFTVIKIEGNPALIELTCVKKLLAYVAGDVGAENRVCRGVGDLFAQCSHSGSDDAVIEPLPTAESEEVERVETAITAAGGRAVVLTPKSGRKRSNARVVILASLVQSASSSNHFCWLLSKQSRVGRSCAVCL